MSRRYSLILKIGIALAVILGVWILYEWLHTNYMWPSEIQRNIFGHVVVERRELVQRDANYGYGQGVFKWEYKVSSDNQKIREYCKASAQTSSVACEFSKRYLVSQNVEQYASYSDGLLTLEEWWK